MARSYAYDEAGRPIAETDFDGRTPVDTLLVCGRAGPAVPASHARSPL
ncbi:hypothetical protein OG735_22595 [Streptomyces sp. NBC_01210]|nr:hypothetical protein OG735_22595 [Streptomyces sp. NBC_01210]